jgi:hypothetical protein
VYTQHFPNTISPRHLIHYLQYLNSGQFQLYDHGLQNLYCYGQPTPPKVPLDKLVAQDLHFLYSKADKMAPYSDLLWTLQQLQPSGNQILLQLDLTTRHLLY